MTFAVIDLGTNTFNLLIAESLPDQSFRKIFNTKIPVKLGESTINSGFISEAPFQRGIQAMKDYKKWIDEYKAEEVLAFATSAVRGASNGLDFVKAILEQTGIRVNVIEGDEEAELIYYGNRMAVDMGEHISLIMDIGGGSNEYILANQHQIFWKGSFKLGAARLLQKFNPSNPMTEDEIQHLKTYLTQEMQALFEAVKLFPPQELIGSSGAFDSVVDMIAGKHNDDNEPDSKTEEDMDMHQYLEISKIIRHSTTEERKQMKGLIAMRVDMIVVSCLLIDFTLESFHLDKIRVSSFSLKEGVIARKLGLKYAG